MEASPYVLLSRHSLSLHDEMDTSVYALFGDEFRKGTLLRRGFAAGKAVVRSSFKLKERPVVKELVITRGLDGFDFINRAGLFVLPEAFAVADKLADLRVPMRVETTPAMDVWHTTIPSVISVRGARKLTTIHDLVPLRLPYTTLDFKAHIALVTRMAVATSDLIVTVSEATKRDLVEFFHVPPERIVVTYQPIALPPAPPSRGEIEKVLKTYGLTRTRYLLFVGAIEPKKNLARLLRGYAMVDTDLPLIIVGGKGWLVEQELAPLKNNPTLAAKVRFLDYLPSDDLPALYAGARCLAFPSLYEGFGLPPLEAMTFGCPVLTSRVSSLPEVCGEAAVYVDPYQPHQIATQLARLIDDANLRSRLAEAGYERARWFSMENYQQRLREAYARVLT